jgi:hypothetical protein
MATFDAFEPRQLTTESAVVLFMALDRVVDKLLHLYESRRLRLVKEGDDS